MTYPTDDPDHTRFLHSTQELPSPALPGVQQPRPRSGRFAAFAMFGGVAVAGALVGGLAVIAYAVLAPQTPAAQPMAARSTQQSAAPHGKAAGARALTGTVVSVQDAAVTVAEAGGQQVTETTTPNTTVHGKGRAAVAQLQPGDKVRVRVNNQSEALAISVS